MTLGDQENNGAIQKTGKSGRSQFGRQYNKFKLGLDDLFLSDGQSLPDNFIAAYTEKNTPVVFRLQEGYDHSY